MITATRYHDISTGHRVAGHENKCASLHGHNYRWHFTIGSPELDNVGRVLDFGVIKSLLCEWLEENYDHKFLLWEHDPLLPAMKYLDGVIAVSYNPTAENMAQYFCEELAPHLLAGTGCVLVKCEIEETRKCKAAYEIRS